MHFFLTGEIQVGKTTIIQKTLFMLQIRAGGFQTYFGDDRGMPNRFLYLSDAALPRTYEQEAAVARFQGKQGAEVFTERFEEYGTMLIQKAKNQADIIVMDECGNLENQAYLFQQEILEALDGNIPILGVVKLSSTGWTERIRNHSNVSLLSVTQENRNQLPGQIAASIMAGGW